LDVNVGDEVIVPNLTYAATASAIVNIGAIPRFVDSDINSWNICADDVSNLINPKTKAIIAVDLYGNPAEMQKIYDLAIDRKIKVIQDSAEAFGATYQGSKLGKYADISTYSFFANKVITCGEGGAVTTTDPELLNRMRLLRGQGMSPSSRYFFEEAGYNFRLSNLSASILSAQLARYDELIEKRNNVFHVYRKHLAVEHVEPKTPENSIMSPWLFSIRLPQSSKLEKNNLAVTLAEKGIQTRPVFYPLSAMPAFNKWVTEGDEIFRNAEIISKQGISLPTYPSLKKNQIIEICKVINAVSSS
jgi:perosamine synthetase